MLNEFDFNVRSEKQIISPQDDWKLIGIWLKWLILHTWDVFVLTYACQLARTLISDLSEGTLHLVHTFIFAIERCLCQIAMAAFYLNGGYVAVFVIRTILGLVWYYMPVGRVDVNLCIFVENYVRRRTTVDKVVVYTIITYLGFMVVWMSTKLICSQMVLGELETHCDVVEYCTSDLKVTAWMGAVIEFLLTFSIRFHGLYVEVYPESQSVLKKIFFVNFVTCYGLEYTGSYCNPIMAFVYLVPCEGLRLVTFVAVYVVAPILGSLLALKLILKYLPPSEEVKPVSPSVARKNGGNPFSTATAKPNTQDQTTPSKTKGQKQVVYS